MNIKVAAGLLLLAAVAAPVWPKPAHSARPAEATYVDPTFGYSVTYPANWQFKPPNADGRIFITSRVEGARDWFRENFNMRPTQLDDANFTMRQIGPGILKQFAHDYPGFAQGKTEYVMWNGVEAMRLDYAFDREEKDVIRRLHAFQNMAVKNGVLYTATFMADDDEYRRFIPIAKRMFDSIKVP